MNLWVSPLCASLILLISRLSYQPNLAKGSVGLVPVGAVRLYHTQRYRRDPSIFGAEEIIYTTTPVKDNPPTLVIQEPHQKEPFLIPIIWYMNDSFTPPTTPPPASSDAGADATVNPTHMVLPVLLGGILDQVLPYTGRWAIVCSAMSYLMRAVPLFLAVRSLDLGFGVPSKVHVMANPDSFYLIRQGMNTFSGDFVAEKLHFFLKEGAFRGLKFQSCHP